MTEEKQAKTGFVGYLLQAWLVLALAVCFGTALAAVEKLTRPLYEENVRKRITQKLAEMFGQPEPSATTTAPAPVITTTEKPIIVEAKIDGRGKRIKCYPALRDGQHVGWGILAVGRGYDDLTLLVGVDAKVKTIKGYRIIKSMETPGIGDKIKPSKTNLFYKQFEDQSAEEQLVRIGPDDKGGPGKINSISGATISSKGVVKIVNDHIDAVKGKLAPINGQEAR